MTVSSGLTVSVFPGPLRGTVESAVVNIQTNFGGQTLRLPGGLDRGILPPQAIIKKSEHQIFDSGSKLRSAKRSLVFSEAQIDTIAPPINTDDGKTASAVIVQPSRMIPDQSSSNLVQKRGGSISVCLRKAR